MSNESAAEYFRAFDTLYRLHEEGRSFSGRERHCAFLNPAGASRRFANVSATSGLDLIDDGRAAAAIDWDHDGDLDLWVANRTAPQLRFLRNDRPGTGRFLAVLPVGSTANRDAVGARAELHLKPGANGEPVRLVRARRAGSGFLAQSSAWLHFGLEPGAEIDRLVVHWPGESSEVFTGLEIGGRYKVFQGKQVFQGTGEGRGSAERWTSPSRAGDLAATEEPSEPTPTPRRALLVSRPPLPRLSYRDFNGASIDLGQHLTGPTLLNLWASWCLPCAAELRDLERHSTDLAAADLEVVALSVDGLDPEKGTGPKQARAFLDRLDASFVFGLAERASLDKLQLLHDRMFSRRIAFAVPTSLLVDPQGRLAAIYRGPVDVDQLLSDVRNLGAGAAQRRRLATPFPGRWFAPPQTLSFESIAKRFAEEGFPEDAAMYLRHALASNVAPRDQAAQSETADLYLALGQLLFRQGDLTGAAQQYRQVLRLRPEDAEANAVLADLLTATGSGKEALALYERAIQIQPSAAVCFNYGNALQLLGRTEAAISQYRRALEIDAGFAGAHNNLAALLSERGEIEVATTHLEHALRLEPDSADAHKPVGVLLLQQGRAEAAAELFSRAMEIDPEHDGARANLTLALGTPR